MKAIKQLIKIASAPFSPNAVDAIPIDPGFELQFKSQSISLTDLLAEKNGFIAFESALLVFPTIKTGQIPSLREWNAPEGWRRIYGDAVPPSIIFFAEDIFANQFGIDCNSVVRFDPETGTITEHSESVEDWASKILENYDFETGHSIGREWQLKNGPLQLGQRLLGKKPFVLGGSYDLENLVAVDGISAMNKLGGLFQQIKDIPDGKKIAVSGWL